MATYALIHGAFDSGWYWHLLSAELRERGHDVVAPDLPSEDDSAGLSEFADTVLGAIGHHSELVAVAQSFGAFTAPLVCDRTAADLLVLVAPLIPTPGETAEDWWANTGYEREDREHAGGDMFTTFYHDVPPELAAEALKHGRGQSDTPSQEPWPLAAWPDVPTRVLICRDDRLLGHVPPSRGPGAPGHHTGRDRRRTLRRPQPPEGAGGAPRGIPGVGGISGVAVAGSWRGRRAKNGVAGLLRLYDPRR